MSIAAHVPVSDHEGQMPPCFKTGECLSSEVAHHFRIRADFGVRFEVRIFTPHAQKKSIGFQFNSFQSELLTSKNYDHRSFWNFIVQFGNVSQMHHDATPGQM